MYRTRMSVQARLLSKLTGQCTDCRTNRSRSRCEEVGRPTSKRFRNVTSLDQGTISTCWHQHGSRPGHHHRHLANARLHRVTTPLHHHRTKSADEGILLAGFLDRHGAVGYPVLLLHLQTIPTGRHLPLGFDCYVVWTFPVVRGADLCVLYFQSVLPCRI